MTADIPDSELAPQARAAWQFVQQMLTDVTAVITADAETERELLEGLRVVARITSLCAQLSVEADPERPRFFDMSPPGQMVGGPNPDGNYYLALTLFTIASVSRAVMSTIRALNSILDQRRQRPRSSPLLHTNIGRKKVACFPKRSGS